MKKNLFGLLLWNSGRWGPVASAAASLPIRSGPPEGTRPAVTVPPRPHHRCIATPWHVRVRNAKLARHPLDRPNGVRYPVVPIINLQGV